LVINPSFRFFSGVGSPVSHSFRSFLNLAMIPSFATFVPLFSPEFERGLFFWVNSLQVGWVVFPGEGGFRAGLLPRCSFDNYYFFLIACLTLSLSDTAIFSLYFLLA